MTFVKIIIFILIMAAGLSATQSNFGRGANEASDTWMSTFSAQVNHESDTDLRTRSATFASSLLSWEVINGTISGQTISSATLTLNLFSNGASEDTTVVYPMRGIGYIMTECTWDSAAVDPGGIDWGADGASNTSTDYFLTPLSDTINAETISDHTWDVTTIVAMWAADTTTNFGFQLRNISIAQGGLDRYNSANSGTAGNRPYLQITHSTPAGDEPLGRRRKILLGGLYEEDIYNTVCVAYSDWR